MALINDGIPTAEDLAKVLPSAERLAKGPVSIIECFQNIPCNPCVAACPQKAISMGDDINNLPKVDTDKCNGCGLCIRKCPGLAILVVDMTYSDDYALVKFPFEYTPVPEKGQKAIGLNRAGEEVGEFEVERAISGGAENKTWTISLKVPKDKAMEVRNIKVGGYK